MAYRYPKLVFLLLLFCTSPSPTFAQSSQESLQHGIARYNKAMATKDRAARLAGFRQAQKLFQQAIEQGAHSAELYANLGTAALQAEQLGPAILALREALQRDPNHSRALRNLRHARSLLPEWASTPPQDSVLDSFFFWHRTLSLPERMGIAAICFFLAAALWAIAWRWRRTGLRNLALLPFGLWVTLMVSAGLAWRTQVQQQEAVVIVQETVARAADSLYSPTRFPEPLPGGTELTILEIRDRWVQTKLANGRDAWVQKVHLGVVGG